MKINRYDKKYDLDSEKFFSQRLIDYRHIRPSVQCTLGQTSKKNVHEHWNRDSALYLLRHRRTKIDLGLQGPINKNRILEQSQVIF